MEISSEFTDKITYAAILFRDEYDSNNKKINSWKKQVNIRKIPPSMFEISCIAKENRSRSILTENKFTNTVLYNLFRVIKCSANETVRSAQQTIIPVFPVFVYSIAVHWDLSVSIKILGLQWSS